ncbi:outer membrane protein transport protein [Pseudomonas sp. St316]|uniref:outer membrane protein transport protein n=1 Tax=Pseudomonas sp. St316 TaxID=2678257 RepID=UPI001BB44999|nr:outer membrane protein transport protein [Pseudomonas sp. St316]
MLLQSTLVLTACTLSATAVANGLAVNEQSASGAGVAYAGRASSALDASTLYGNPAGLSKLKRTEVSGGFAVISAKDNISDVQSAVPGSNKGDSVPLITVPFGYFSTPINHDFTFGMGVYVPDGLVNDYERNFQGRYHGSYSKVQVVTLQPTLAYRINDRVTIGGGPTINRIEGDLQNDLATGALNGGTDTRIKIKGDDISLGYNLGVMVDLSDATTWGITYHSKVEYHLEGHTEVSDAPSIFGLNGKYKTSMDATLPESVNTSFTHRFNERWTGYLGSTWTRWSRLQKLEANNKGVPALGQQLGFNTIGDELSWHDTLSVAVGAAYQFDRQWVLRAGFAYDPSPTNNSDREVRIPVGNRRSLTLGAGYSPNADITIDVAYGYLWENSSSVSQADTSGLQPAYSAKYENSANALAAQLTYRF